MEINRVCTVYMKRYTYHGQLYNLLIYKEGKADRNSYLFKHNGWVVQKCRLIQRSIFNAVTSMSTSILPAKWVLQKPVMHSCHISIKTWVIYRVRFEFIETNKHCSQGHTDRYSCCFSFLFFFKQYKPFSVLSYLNSLPYTQCLRKIIRNMGKLISRNRWIFYWAGCWLLTLSLCLQFSLLFCLQSNKWNKD